jgi:hypothetical protein
MDVLTDRLATITVQQTMKMAHALMMSLVARTVEPLILTDKLAEMMVHAVIHLLKSVGAWTQELLTTILELTKTRDASTTFMAAQITKPRTLALERQ